MVASVKSEQDQNKGSGSMWTPQMCSKVSQDVGESSLESTQIKDQFSSRDDYAPKVRKPYMITKQRESWTEDEHQKFIEALKLYGRAWKRIEEHVGTKTAVQIRSHAQKFFSKVVRESSSANTVKAVEIPPPRPKRKPVHPYPRKLKYSSQSIDTTAETPVRSASMSPCLSGLEYKNQSPTSVLSAVDTFEANTPIRSISPVLSATDVPDGGSICSAFLNRLSSDDQANSSPTSEEAAAKLLMISQDNGLPREGSVDASSSWCLKLFGKTMIVTDSHTESMPTVVIRKPETINATEGSPVETLNWNVVPDNRGAQDMYFINEGSSSGSNTESICLKGDEDSKRRIEAQSLEISLGRAQEFLASRSSETNKLKHRTSLKGFVPYKRCIADRGTHSSMMSEPMEQRIHLSL